MKGIPLRNILRSHNEAIMLKAQVCDQEGGVDVFVQLPVLHMNCGDRLIALSAGWNDIVAEDDQFTFKVKAQAYDFYKIVGAVINPSDVCYLTWEWFELSLTGKTKIDYNDLVPAGQKDELSVKLLKLSRTTDPLELGAPIPFKRNYDHKA